MTNTHPFQPYIPSEATRLIIGTIPPERFCLHKNKRIGELNPDDVDFYYGSRDNYFWELVGEVFNVEFIYGSGGKEQRELFLANKSIGITDIINTCERENGSASDDKLSDETFKDIASLLKDNPSITTLIYTSDQVKTYINKKLGIYHSIDKSNRKRQHFKFNGRVYDVWILYSPSPQALINLGPNGQQIRREQYLNVFNNL